MTLTLGSHKLSCTHLFDYKYRLSPHRIHQFVGNLLFEGHRLNKLIRTRIPNAAY